MFTLREVAELQAYYRRYPFDDESTFHVPAAQLAAMKFNSMRRPDAEPRGVDDFLVFKPDPVAALNDELDRQIATFFKDL